MQTATATRTTSKFDSFDFNKLPMFEGVDTTKLMESANEMTKGQLGFYNFFRLIVFGAIGYGLWVYALPEAFRILGQWLGIAIGLASVIFLFLARKGIFKLLKSAARAVDKIAIRNAPFEEFERQKQEMLRNKTEFYQKSEGMVKIEQDMKKYAFESEQKAIEYKEQVGKLKRELEDVRKKLTEATDKESPEYTDLLNKADRKHAEADGLRIRFEQAQELTRKYGVRGNQFAKLNRKLSRVANHMDIKIMKFDNTVFLLKQDYNFAKNSADSTDAMKRAMLFDQPWELEYATDFVSSAITSYISTTKVNMKDIESLTANFNVDDDSIFDKIDKLSARIDSGEEKLVAANSYNNPDKVMTTEDNAASGGFGSIGL